jgi:hypothetical protein
VSLQCQLGVDNIGMISSLSGVAFYLPYPRTVMHRSPPHVCCAAQSPWQLPISTSRVEYSLALSLQSHPPADPHCSLLENTRITSIRVELPIETYVTPSDLLKPHLTFNFAQSLCSHKAESFNQLQSWRSLRGATAITISDPSQQ